MLQPHGVATHDKRQAGIDFNIDRQFFGLGALDDQTADIGHDIGWREFGVFQHQFAGFDFGEIENVVEHGQQVLRGAAHFGQPIALRRGFGIALGEMAEAHDGVERGADFVTHIGQEGALGAAGRFGLILGDDQLGGAFLDQCFEALLHIFLSIAPLSDVLNSADHFQHVACFIHLEFAGAEHPAGDAIVVTDDAVFVFETLFFAEDFVLGISG